MMNKIIATFTILWVSLTAQAQPGITHEDSYRYDDATQIWHNSMNAAGMTLDSMRTRGLAGFIIQHKGGDFHRVQEGEQTNTLTFFTERYQPLGKHLYGYGNFSFRTGRTKGRAWSDVYRSYNSNPYFAGSSIKGSYDMQDVDLVAAVSTIDMNGFRYGIRIDYNLGDLSRLRDPRSRSNLLNYKLTPSITYTFGTNTLGLSLNYNRRKEKIANITTVQTDATLVYYQFTGMENITGMANGFSGFSREWVNHSFGAELAYAHRTSTLHSLSTISIESGTEAVYGKIKYEPGKYRSFIYGMNTQNRIYSGKIFHQIDLKARYEQAYADEFRQQLEITKDSLHGFTSEKYNTLLTFKKRYQVNLLEMNFRYRTNITNGKRDVKSYLGVSADFRDTRNKHLLKYSELKYSSLELNLEGGTSLLNNRRLWIDALAGYHFSTKANQTLADSTTMYAVNVLIPDLEYYRANYFKSRLQVMYQFPLVIRKTRSIWYAKLYADYLKATSNRHAHAVGISIGVFN